MDLSAGKRGRDPFLYLRTFPYLMYLSGARASSMASSEQIETVFGARADLWLVSAVKERQSRSGCLAKSLRIAVLRDRKWLWLRDRTM
jgi:hypothetical protein